MFHHEQTDWSVYGAHISDFFLVTRPINKTNFLEQIKQLVTGHFQFRQFNASNLGYFT